MRQAGFERGQILLLTDRADGTDIAAAAKANAAGYRVSVLGVGTARGGVFDTSEGLGQARLDAPALRRRAAGGGGGYQPLSPGDADPAAWVVREPRPETGPTAGITRSWVFPAPHGSPPTPNLPSAAPTAVGS